ncbi:MAG: hypothetical protein ACREBS_10245, partial [Nitrososphaerales archaeon]
VWVADDYLWIKNSDPHGLACMMTLDQVRENINGEPTKYPEAQFVIAIKKSVADIASDYELEGLIKHEAAHWHLGHAGKQSTPELEKEVAEVLGETEIANNLFAMRYLVIHNKEIKKASWESIW